MNYNKNLENLLSFFRKELKQDLEAEEQKLKLLSPDSALRVYHSFFILLMKRLETREKNNEVRRLLILARAYHQTMIRYQGQKKYQQQLESFRSFLESAAWSAARSAAWSVESAASSTAESAAWYAASSAASAASSAARSVAKSAVSSAWSAAWSAEYAAWSAVALSARSAAWSVEIQEQLEDLREVL